MRAVIQRVQKGEVVVAGNTISAIERGFVILLGIGPQDDQNTVRSMARKIALLRIFSDDQGKMNLSLADIHGAAIVVSQFTLYANTQKGNRPSFVEAAPPEIASPLVDFFVACMREHGIPTQTGEFGAHMLVKIENDGPVTIFLEM